MRIIAPTNVTDMGTAVMIADDKARLTGKKYMVLYDHKKEVYHIRGYGKYTVHEELCYIRE